MTFGEYKMHMKKIIRVIVFLSVIILVTACRPLTASCGETEENSDRLIEEQMNLIDFDGVIGVIGGSESKAASDMDFFGTVVKAVKGELGLSPAEILKNFGGALFSEIHELLGIIRDMIIIVVLGAIFKALSSSLKTKSVSELGFYVNYIIVVTLLLSSFGGCVGVMRDFVGELCRFAEAAMPLMVSLMVISGNPGTAYVFNPIIMFGISGLEALINNFITPAIVFAAVLEIVNNISNGETLQKLAELVKKAASLSLKALAVIFGAVLSLQRISAPIVNGIAVKAAKTAVGAVPVVGQALNGAVDAVLYWSGAVKNGVMVAVILAIALMCLTPVIKIAAFMLVYKLTAALIQPICDKRIVNAVSAAGSLAAIALGACALAGVMFVFMAMIIISI